MREGGIRRFCPRRSYQSSPFRGKDYMIPHIIGRLALNSTHFTRGLVKYSPRKGLFSCSPLLKRGLVCDIRPPHSLNDSLGCSYVEIGMKNVKLTLRASSSNDNHESTTLERRRCCWRCCVSTFRQHRP